METLLDELEEIICVIDAETYQMRYLNLAGRRRVNAMTNNDYKGKPCYQVLQGKKSPCPFCFELNLQEHPIGAPFQVRDYTSDLQKRHYVLKEKLIDWNGRLSRFTIAVDVTEKEEISRTIQHKIEIEEILLSHSRRLNESEQSAQGVFEALRSIGEHYYADRAYIFELTDDGPVRNTYEWCADGIIPQIDSLQNVSRSDVSRWLSILQEGKAIIIPDLEQIKTVNLIEYQALSVQGIHSLLVVRLCDEGSGEIKGFIGVDNPRSNPEDTTLLESLSFFINAFLQKQKLILRLKRMSYQDGLTGLFNRNRYAEQIAVLERIPPNTLGILLVDVDNLKQINERRGHSYGDACLIRTADQLVVCFSHGEIYRTGDDEFSVLWAECEKEEFLSAAAQLRELACKEDYSLSIAQVWSDRITSISAMNENADELLSLQKQRAYQANRLQDYHRKSPFLDELLFALKNGQYEVFLQAKCDATNSSLCGAEALVRRRTEAEGIVSPAAFIPIFEREMIVRHIDFFVFRQVCLLIRRWIDTDGRVVPVSVNFSRVTLMESDFIDTLLKIWEECPVPKHLLELEVTESADRMGMGPLLELIKQLRELGFRVSLDDFGSQYTNLQMLMEINVDSIKFDRSLVSQIEDGERNRMLLNYLFLFCSRVGVLTIAEGVETNQQFELLRGMGCDCIQGFLFARPIPVGEFEQQYLLVDPPPVDAFGKGGIL